MKLKWLAHYHLCTHSN